MFTRIILKREGYNIEIPVIDAPESLAMGDKIWIDMFGNGAPADSWPIERWPVVQCRCWSTPGVLMLICSASGELCGHLEGIAKEEYRISLLSDVMLKFPPQTWHSKNFT